ncbi:MAG: fibronectin type III domain-containing protein [Elusimicrobia bacterium]|nr:fibronectin type III domain-containing protein [Elusimicrobiota bacterium]
MSGTINISGDLSANATTWLQGGLSTNTASGPFTAQAFNSTGTADSGAASRNTLAVAPAGLAVTAVSSQAVSLSWSANSNPGGTPFELERSTDGASYAFLDSTTLTGYTDFGILPAATYFYQVRARNGDAVATGYSGPVSTRTDAGNGPSGFAGEAQSANAILWSWSDNALDEDGYRVMSGTINISGDLSADATTWLQGGLSTNTAYGPYTAQAFNAGGTANSGAASRFTLAVDPAAIAVTGLSSTSVALSWSANSNPGGTQFELERSTDGADYVFLTSTTLTAYTDLGLFPAATYFYQVRTKNGDAVATAYDGPVSTRTDAANGPAAPSGFAGATQSDNAIIWSWTDNAFNEDGYRVMSGTVNISGDLAANTTTWLQGGLSTNTAYGPYTAQAFNSGGTANSGSASTSTLAVNPASIFAGTAQSVNAVLWSWTDNAGTESGYRVMSGTINISGDLAANTTTWLQSSLSTNTAYGPYTAQTFNAGGTANSGSASRFTLAVDPAGIAVTGLSSTSVSLSWSANSNPGGTSFELERSSGSGYVFLASTTLTGYTDFGLLPATTYFYQVRAKNGDAVDTAYDGPVSTRTNAQDPPAAPSGFAGTALSPAFILWSWTDNAGTESGYRVMSGTISISGDLAANTTTWLQGGLSTNTAYGSYTAQAFNDGGTANSGAASRNTLAVAPAGLAATAVSSTSVSLSWLANSNPGGTPFELERSTNGLGYVFLASTTLTAYADFAVLPNTTYFYQVRAKNGEAVVTAYDGPVSTRTNIQNGPGAPAGLTGMAQGPTSIFLSWNDNAANEDGYRVFLGTVNLSGDLAANTTTWLHSGLSTNTLYGPYTVQAFNTSGTANSGSVNKYTAAAIPTFFGYGSDSSITMFLSWSANTNPAGTVFDLERAVSSGSFFQISTATSGLLTCPRDSVERA